MKTNVSESSRERQVQQSAILDALPANIALLNSKGVIVLVNQAWKKFADANQLTANNYCLGDNYITLTENSACPGTYSGKEIANALREIIAGNKVGFSCEYPCHSPNQKRWFQLKITPIQLTDERGAVVMHSDITERKLTEEALRRSESKLAAIVENTEDMIYSLDTDFRYVTFNTPMKNAVKQAYDIDIKPNDKIFDFLEKLDEPEARNWEKTYTTALSGKTIRFIKDYSGPGGPSFFRFVINPIWENNVIIGLSCFARNITAQKLDTDKITELNESLELKVKERTLELEEANRELETFSYTVSHDLKSPLRVLSGYSKILIKDYADKLDGEGMELLNNISASAARMNDLIHDLLHLSKLGKAPIERREVNVHKLVKEVIDESLMDTANLKAEVKLQELHHGNSDPGLIKQVWCNLIGNALKYSSKKEKPLIEIGMIEINKEKIYYVKDNGTGFDMKFADKLFRPFQRLHKYDEFEGTGVGLALAHRIITKHGGRIWAEASVGKGAVFYFTIPEA